MYEQLFDREKQREMRNYFINLSKKIGHVKSYKKNETIKFENSDFIGIVKKGLVSENIVSSKGKIHTLFVLTDGELLGETLYFSGGEYFTLAIAKEDTDISFLKSDVLDIELINNSEAYRYFIHSIIRKYRIILLQLTNHIFNDSMGKVADALLRLSSCSYEDNLEITIDQVITHQELANIIGCSRVTVTNCLDELLDNGIISYHNKMIIINKPDVLKSYVDSIVD